VHLEVAGLRHPQASPGTLTCGVVVVLLLKPRLYVFDLVADPAAEQKAAWAVAVVAPVAQRRRKGTAA
jgi:hypothetical protein